eukprot:GHVU01168864.1.p1 GENE.GHVU01168864.1~~GHVU01168864.1.p1  ORF type:complete len:179 (+),score=7.88 GHVU01168864.1:252-788(+)
MNYCMSLLSTPVRATIEWMESAERARSMHLLLPAPVSKIESENFVGVAFLGLAESAFHVTGNVAAAEVVSPVVPEWRKEGRKEVVKTLFSRSPGRPPVSQSVATLLCQSVSQSVTNLLQAGGFPPRGNWCRHSGAVILISMHHRVPRCCIVRSSTCAVGNTARTGGAATGSVGPTWRI